MEYIQEGSTLPYPLNIIPSPKSIVRCLIAVFNCCCCRNKDEEEEDEKKEPPSYPTHNVLAKTATNSPEKYRRRAMTTGSHPQLKGHRSMVRDLEGVSTVEI